MKYLVILADGLADEPLEQLGGQTVVMAARTPNIDALCRQSAVGLLHTVPDTLHPGSEVANMSIMGYDAAACYQGRGVLEAASMGVEIFPGDLVMRCNLVSAEGDVLLNHSGGHISTPEAAELIDALNDAFADSRTRFHKGVSYRHVLVVKGGQGGIRFVPPHDVPGAKLSDIMPSGAADHETLHLLQDLIGRSRALLEAHPVNQRRKAAGKSMANLIWPWSAGFKPDMPLLTQQYGFSSGAVISAVDLIHGIGRLGGLDSIHVEGATGLYNTNYSGKAAAALAGLKSYQYLFLHIEAPDEAGHEGDVDLKIKTIEDIDRLVVGPIVAELDGWNEPVTIAFLPDHPTPCALRTHTRSAVPFLIRKPGLKADLVTEYNEVSARDGSLGVLRGIEFMKLLMAPTAVAAKSFD